MLGVRIPLDGQKIKTMITQEIIERLGLTTPAKIAQFAVEARYKRNELDGISDFELNRIVKESIELLLNPESEYPKFNDFRKPVNLSEIAKGDKFFHDGRIYWKIDNAPDRSLVKPLYACVFEQPPKEDWFRSNLKVYRVRTFKDPRILS